MCSSTQPKMFSGQMPLGTGGNTPLPTVYQANAAPIADASSAPPPTPVSGAPAVTAQNNPVGANQWRMPPSIYQKWGGMMGGGMSPKGNPYGGLPTMQRGPGMMG